MVYEKFENYLNGKKIKLWNIILWKIKQIMQCVLKVL